MVAALLLMITQATVPVTETPQEVVVVGRRAEKALADCLARSCPPAEEVEAALQASVEQFSDGRYAGARRVLQQAIQRNKRHASTLPGPVASLYATLSTVAEHEGDQDMWWKAARQSVTILREYVGVSDIATLGQELAFADTLVKSGSRPTASGIYRKVQSLAAAMVYRQIAAGAAFRRAWLALSENDLKEAERLAGEAVAVAGDDRLIAELRAVLLARIAIRRGDSAAIERLALTLRQSAGQSPRLLFAKPFEDFNLLQSGRQVDPFHDSVIRFADVGYWVRPDGRTADAELLRDGGLGRWAPGVLRNVMSRRYAPFDREPGNPGLYRIDRVTVRATFGVPSGSRIRTRMGALTVHVVDLTETEAMSEARRAQTAKAVVPDVTANIEQR